MESSFICIRRTSLSVELLIVQDVMLCSSNNTFLLDTLDGFSSSNTLEIRILTTGLYRIEILLVHARYFEEPKTYPSHDHLRRFCKVEKLCEKDAKKYCVVEFYVPHEIHGRT